MDEAELLTAHRKARRAKQRARSARKRRAVIAAAFLWTVEVLAASAIGAIAAAIFCPIASAERGYAAFGGEWALVLIVTLLAYHIIHGAVFKRLEN